MLSEKILNSSKYHSISFGEYEDHFCYDCMSEYHKTRIFPDNDTGEILKCSSCDADILSIWHIDKLLENVLDRHNCSYDDTSW